MLKPQSTNCSIAFVCGVFSPSWPQLQAPVSLFKQNACREAAVTSAGASGRIPAQGNQTQSTAGLKRRHQPFPPHLSPSFHQQIVHSRGRWFGVAALPTASWGRRGEESSAGCPSFSNRHAGQGPAARTSQWHFQAFGLCPSCHTSTTSGDEQWLWPGSAAGLPLSQTLVLMGQSKGKGWT